MFLIGVVLPPQPPQLLQPSAQQDMAMTLFQWVTARLRKRVEVSKDVRLLTFDFPSAQGRKKALLPIGQHLLIGAAVDAQAFLVRPYGPVRPLKVEENDGTVDVLLKVYFPTPTKPGGVLSCHLDSLREGDEVKMKGPTGPLLYEGKGRMAYQGRSFHVTHVNLVCGGTGIAPAYQLLRAFLEEGGENSITGVALIYSNKTPADILLRQELDEMAQKHSARFHLFYSVDRLQSPMGHDEGEHKEQRAHDIDDQQGSEKPKAREQPPVYQARTNHSQRQQLQQREGRQEDHRGAKDEKNDSDGWPFNLGRVNEALVRSHSFSPSPSTVCFVCGPPPMLELAVYAVLDQMGFDRQSQVLSF